MSSSPDVAAAQDRLPPIPAQQLTDAQQLAISEFRAARGTDVFGPFIPLLRSPELMSRVRALGDHLRFHSTLPARLNEFVILLTARDWTQQFEWSVHHPIALRAGVGADTVDAIAEGRRPLNLTDDEALLYDLYFELQRNHGLSDATYARAVARFGEQGVMDTVGVVGYYTLLAMVLNTARTPATGTNVPALSALPR